LTSFLRNRKTKGAVVNARHTFRLILGVMLAVVCAAVGWHLFVIRVAPEATSSFTDEETQAIKDFTVAYQTVPGPSDETVKQTSKILLERAARPAVVKTVLGEPTSVHVDPQKDDRVVCLWYDIGDSRAISFLFGAEGYLTEVQGVGVGFDRLTHDSAGSQIHQKP
jgi:hypothetical protein